MRYGQSGTCNHELTSPFNTDNWQLVNYVRNTFLACKTSSRKNKYLMQDAWPSVFHRVVGDEFDSLCSPAFVQLIWSVSMQQNMSELMSLGYHLRRFGSNLRHLKIKCNNYKNRFSRIHLGPCTFAYWEYNMCVSDLLSIE